EDVAFAQDGDGLVVGVLGHQLVDQRDGGGGRGVLFVGGERSGDGEGVLLPAGQADVDGDVLAVADQGDVGDEQPDQALALAHRGRRVVPERGQVGGQGADPLLLLLVEGGGVVAAGSFVVVLGVAHFTQFVVPVCFQ